MSLLLARVAVLAAFAEAFFVEGVVVFEPFLWALLALYGVLDHGLSRIASSIYFVEERDRTSEG